MSDQDQEARETADAARVTAAREDIVLALGPVAASPLDEPAVDRIRRILARADSAAVRSALRRLTRSVRVPLRVGGLVLVSVPAVEDGAPADRARTAQRRARTCDTEAVQLPGGAA